MFNEMRISGSDLSLPFRAVPIILNFRQLAFMLAQLLLGNGVRLKLPNTLLGLHQHFLPQTAPKFCSAANAVRGSEFGRRKFSSAGLRLTRLSPPDNSRSYTISQPRTKLTRLLDSRFFSANSAQFAASSPPLPVLSPPSVGRWLLFSSALVFAVIVVGGVTRLTESGLSITEWRPITGILPPLSNAEWNQEFEKYKTTPEFKL
jgi:cytochrome c oxidase assembly protein subunit 15